MPDIECDRLRLDIINMLENESAWNLRRSRDEAILRGEMDRLAQTYFAVSSVLNLMAEKVLGRTENTPIEHQGPNYAVCTDKIYISGEIETGVFVDGVKVG